MSRLVMHFRHPDSIQRRIESIKGRSGWIELISEDDNQISHHEQAQSEQKSPSVFMGSLDGLNKVIEAVRF